MNKKPSTAIAVFVKTPGLSPVKTRLAGRIGKETAEAFYALSLKTVIETLSQTSAKVFWAVGEQEGLHSPLWKDFETLYTGEGDLGDRQHHIYETLQKEFGTVLLAGADIPQLSPSIFHDAMVRLQPHPFVVGPSQDGGYYLFGGRQPVDQKIWKAVPWSTEETRTTLEQYLPQKPYHFNALTDVDTVDDLRAVLDEMPPNPSASQQELIQWIKTAVFAKDGR